MKMIEAEFETNANSTGLQQFRMIVQGTNDKGKHVYIYQRSHASGEELGKLFGFEVFIPSVKKAGRYKLPTPKGEEQKWITYEEDFEEYPGASKFGHSAWFVQNLKRAEEIYEGLMKADVVDAEDEEDAAATVPEPKVPRVAKSPLTLPSGEFSVKEAAEKAGVAYPVAFIFIKEQVAAGKVKETRKERRNVKGKETQLYQTI